MKLKDILPILDDPEALRIAAAEADGWVRIPWEDLTTVREALETKTYCPSTKARYCGWLPYYHQDVNSVIKAEERLGLHDRTNLALRVRWVNFLHELIETLPDTPKNKCGSPVVSDIDKLLAPPKIRCAAFILTAHWKKSLTQPAT